MLTLWNDNANNPQLDNAEGQVIQVGSLCTQAVSVLACASRACSMRVNHALDVT